MGYHAAENEWLEKLHHKERTAMHECEASGLTFKRLENGDVLISGVGGFTYQINDGHWGSTVLCMTAFGERPNDFNRFMDHHHGRKDLLPPL